MKTYYHYPAGTVRALLDTDMVTDATRQALTERLTKQPSAPKFFSEAELSLLKAICGRLIPQPDRTEPIDIAGGIDERLAGNKSDGWRYDTMPADGDAYRTGLQGVDESAQALFEQPFLQLTGDQQDEVLRRVQAADAPGAVWDKIPSERFFEEMLAEVVGTYYSHPLAQEEIGYVGMADVPTWQRIQLNELETREPKPLDQ
ncbi:gluconate 2-dehydrogenase subunit 3 family protein [Spirosoma sp. KUDC1026]|uniref:gluconate 2-dehydrogenase subunit 3 family protein n=1 Tax=Spirosoma sp. KUDC1026 TaxID=2745947 RepID=UPI00159BE919|nr:gluconate 2-dehydrogenase subunit 3 family protein [Spirosoma sp. KUDC1026]QKZ11803.1 gluconate 2-dehydrogenase subunit 3 family protein [Spirosoma sp. KUDC1026]